MKSDPIKILVFSSDASFLHEQSQELKRYFTVQRASQLDVFTFLLREWTPQYFLIDKKYLPANDLKGHMQQAHWAHSCICLYDTYSAADEEKYLSAEVDCYLNRGISSSGLKHYLINHYNKWFAKNTVTFDPLKPSDQSQPNQYLEYGNLKIYPESYLVKSFGQIVNTSPIQFRLLLSFIKNSDQLLTRKWLQEYVWDGSNISPRSIDAQISKLKKLVPVIDQHLINVYGKGYILTAAQTTGSQAA